MNDEELKKNLKKHFKILAISAKIQEEAYRLASEIVDKYMPYKEMLDEVTLKSERHGLRMNREEAISAVAANILTIADDVRL